MLALLCSCLLLAAGASDAWTGEDSVEPNSDSAEWIRDMYAKVTEIWQEVMQRRD
ncbi:SOD3 isoform 2, partial [Pongo abelii]